MCKLESRQAITSLGLAANNVNDLLDQLSTLGIVAFCPVVGGRRLAIDKVVRSKQLAQGACPHSVQGGRLEIDEDGARDVLLVANFIQVDVSAGDLLGIFTSVTIKQRMYVLAQCSRLSSSFRAEANTYTPSLSIPCSPRMVCQNAVPTWLPCRHQVRGSFTASS